MPRRPLMLLILCLGFLLGCAGVGPRALETARGSYNEVLRDTADEQLLANLVRLRYRDRPFFLEVSAVTTQFRFAPNAGAGLALEGFFEDDWDDDASPLNRYFPIYLAMQSRKRG